MTVEADPVVVRVGVMRYIIKNVIFAIMVMLILFWLGDDWGWPQGWVHMAAYLVNQVILVFTLPNELLAERSERQAGSKSWDTLLTAFAALYLPLGTYAISALDHRNGWSGSSVPTWLWIIALIVMVGGIAFTTWAMITNAFFSGLVRIQEDRGHTVVSHGPYRIVRHPGYVGAILYNISAPLVLLSWWALIPGALACLLFIIRTGLEDRVLQEELEGYAEYTEETPHKLAPGIW